MLSRRVERVLPYSAEQLFDLAADVERYPAFLRWWISARVRQREGEVYYTDQVLGLGSIRVRFDSKTVLHPPAQIDVTSEQRLFRRFRLSWLFTPEPDNSCRVALVVEIEFGSRLLQKIVEQVLPVAIGDIIAAFEAEAHRLYGDAMRPHHADGMSR